MLYPKDASFYVVRLRCAFLQCHWVTEPGVSVFRGDVAGFCDEGIRVLHYTSLLIDCSRGATPLTGCPPCRRILRLSVFQQKVLSRVSLDKDSHVFTVWVAFHLWSLMVKPGPVSSNWSGRESLWVLVKSKQLLAFLHPSLLCLGLRSFETQSAQTFFIFKSLRIIA